MAPVLHDNHWWCYTLHWDSKKLFVLDSLVELQRCVKNSMGNGNWMKEWRQVGRQLQAMESERGDKIS